METIIKDRYTLGEALRVAREAKNLTQAQVAEKMGVRQDTVSSLETGRFGPNLDTIIRYCKAVKKNIFVG